MAKNASILFITVALFVGCRGSNLVSSLEKSQNNPSERVTLGTCFFRAPPPEKFGNCSRNTRIYSRCTCAKNGVFTFCSSKGMITVPETPSLVRVLLLDHNKISVINDAPFRNATNLLYLDLSFNGIIFIGKTTFIRLKKLETLLLQNNKLKYLEEGLLSIDFSPMVNLKCLRIEQDTGFNDNYDYPIYRLKSLQDLCTLFMNGIPGRSFNKTFLELTNLQNLVLNGIDGYCNISEVDRRTFKNLAQITELSMINCNLTLIHNRSFSVLRNLKSLNLSYNEGLHFQSIRNITYSLINLTNFEWLNLTKIHYTFGKCTFLDSSMLQYINQTTVSKLILDDNRLSGMTLNSVDFFPRTLTYFSVNKNKLDTGLYFIKGICNFRDLFGELKTFESANQNYRKRIGELFSLFFKNNIWSYEYDTQSLYPLTHEYQTPSIWKCFQRGFLNCSNCPTNIRPCPHAPELPCFYPFPFPISHKLETLDFSGSLYKFRLDNICLCKPNNLMNLKLNKNLVYSFPGPFYGFENMQNLDLSENYCQNITEASFSSMANLRKLNLSSNYLGPIINNFSAMLPFKHLVRLQQLDLSNNKLRTLPFQLFSNLFNLKYLSLSENRLSRMEVNMGQLIHLKYLNLSGNLIETFSDDVMEALDKVASRNKLKINLIANNFICICKHEAFIKWLVLNRKRLIGFQTYYCHFDNGEKVSLHTRDILNRLRKECTDYSTMVLVTSLCVGAALIGIISAVLYRYRWRIRYMYYSAKLKCKGYSRVDQHDHFQFDIFVSYADSEKEFVHESMISELEVNRGLRLLVHERDFPFGKQVIENIHNAISSSRKTLLFISKGFLQSKWCKYEMNIAKIEEIKRDREVLCVVMKEHVGTFKIPAELTEIIAKNTYLSVPSDRGDMERFWDTIQCSI